ncbi:hypothetical protein RBB50_003932 [Rhinocladiella similis]
MRISDSAEKTDDQFGVQLAPSPFVKRKVANKDIDNYCTADNLNLDGRNSRYKVRKELEKTQHDQWATHQRVVLNTQSNFTTQRTSLQDFTNTSQSRSVIKKKDDTTETVDFINNEMSNVLSFGEVEGSRGQSHHYLFALRRLKTLDFTMR